MSTYSPETFNGAAPLPPGTIAPDQRMTTTTTDPMTALPAPAREYYSPLNSSSTTDRDQDPTVPRHLQSDNISLASQNTLTTPHYSPSIAPSESLSMRPSNRASIDTTTTTTTPTPLPLPTSATDATAQSQPPKWGPGSPYGHGSEAAYLSALRAWAEEKKFMTPGEGIAATQLEGFYGKKTMGDYIASGEPVSFSRRLRKGSSAARAEGRSGDGAANELGEEENGVGVGASEGVHMDGDDAALGGMTGPSAGRRQSRSQPRERRRSSLGNVLRRFSRTAEKAGG